MLWLSLLIAQPYYTGEYRNMLVEVMRGSSFAAPNTWQYTTGHPWGFGTEGRWFNNAHGLEAYYGSLRKSLQGDDN